MTKIKEILSTEELNWLYIQAGIKQLSKRNGKTDLSQLQEDNPSQGEISSLPNKHHRPTTEGIHKMS